MRVIVDLGAYRRNVASLRARLRPGELMAVVKDDAYGHGRDHIVDAALSEGVRHFAVLDSETGVALRERGVDQEIMLLAWLFDPHEDFAEAITHRVDLGVSNQQVLERIIASARATGVAARVHLKIDTGLHRNGADPEQWPDLVAAAREGEIAGHLEIVGLWTHIGEASDEDDDAAQAIFETAITQAGEHGVKKPVLHLAASAAAFARPEFRYDLARVGGFTFGVAPGSGVGPGQLGIEPVMTAVADISEVLHDSQQSLAVLNVGYLDGIPAWNLPALSGESGPLPRAGFDVAIHGQRHPIIRVGADQTVVALSVTDKPVQVGDSAVLFGSHHRGEPVLQEWADATGTVGEEIVVRVGSQAQRSYIA